MGECLHWPAEGLLADEGESVCVVNHDPAEGIWFGMRPLTEVVDLVADGVNPAVLLAGKPENRFQVEGGFFAEEGNKVF
jgi:hypothetical protein